MTKTTDKPKRRGPGRPPFVATAEQRRQVELLAGLGLTRVQIGHILGCSDDTVARKFPRELVLGDARAAAKVAQSLFQAATGWMKEGADGRIGGAPVQANITAAIWWEKSRLGRTERVQVDASVKGKTEHAVTAEVHVSTNDADRQAAQLMAVIESLLPGGAGGAGLVAEDGAAEAAPAGGGVVDVVAAGGARVR